MNLLSVALRYLQQRKTRTVLTTLAIVFGVAVIYGTNAMLPAMNNAIENATLPPDNPTVVVVPGFSRDATDFSAAQLAALRATPGITNVAAAIERQIQLPLAGLSGLPAPATRVQGIDPAEDYRAAYQTTSGRFLTATDSQAIVISAFLAGMGNLREGSTLTLTNGARTYQAQVIGVLAYTPYGADVVMPLAEARAFLNMPENFNRLAVTVGTTLRATDLLRALDGTLGENLYTIAGAGNPAAASMSNAFMGAVFNIFGGLALAVGAFLVFITFSTAVIERKRDLGILRAIGAERRQVARLMTLETLIQGAAGTLIGLMLGQVFAFAMLRVLWNSSYPQFAAPAMIPVHLPALALAVFIGLLTALVAGYFPSRAAARLSPLEALRNLPVEAVRRVAVVRLAVGGILWVTAAALLLSRRDISGLATPLLLIGAVLLVPALIRPVMRLVLPLIERLFPRVADIIRASALRQSWRTAATVNLLVIGFAVFTGVMALISPIAASTERMVNSQAPDSDAAFYALNPTKGEGERLAEAIRGTANVARITYTAGTTTTTSTGREIGVKTIDPAVAARMLNIWLSEAGPGLVVSFGEETVGPVMTRLSEGQSALITGPLRMAEGLRVGGMITLTTASGPKTYNVIGVVVEPFDQQNGLGVVLAHAPQDWPEATIQAVYAGFTDPGQGPATFEALTLNVMTRFPQFFMDNLMAQRERMVASSRQGLSIFYVLAALVLIPSVLGLLNTLVMNVMERTREIGMLRAIGASRAQIRRAVIGEGLLLAVLSAIIGVIVGVGMGYGLLTTLQAVNRGATEYVFNIPLPGFTLAMIAGLGLVVLATLAPARRAVRLNILDALRSE